MHNNVYYMEVSAVGRLSQNWEILCDFVFLILPKRYVQAKRPGKETLVSI